MYIGEEVGRDDLFGSGPGGGAVIIIAIALVVELSDSVDVDEIAK